MILDISDNAFRRIMSSKYYLPIKWSGVNFELTLEQLFNDYINSVETIHDDDEIRDISIDVEKIKSICGLILHAVRDHLNGFPSKAYDSIDKAMHILMQKQLKIYYKSIHTESEFEDDLDLFRVVLVDENIPYTRSRVFHTPYYLRAKIATNRYSIAGYPSLYLANNLKLCCEEIHYNPHRSLAIAARYRLERNINYNNTNINVIELAIKPQDFLESFESTKIRNIDASLNDPKIKEAYLLWYPLIAACSYIRPNKRDPFAAEYIIPQLLMQWARIKMAEPLSKNDKLIGIRYFSCASVKASEMGVNYVFPVSGEYKSAEYPFCPVLMKVFKLTKPYCLNECEDIASCERQLERDTNIRFIDY